MNLTQLRSFVTVCKTLNFTNAAKQVGVPQSTISRQINDLEEKLEVRLFHRTKRDVQLTAEGRAFLIYAHDILDIAQNGINAVKQLNTGAKGRLSLATVETDHWVLGGYIKQFSERYPDIAVDIHYISPAEALLDDGSDTYDFHFMYQDMIPENDDLDTMITHEDPLCLVLPKGHYLAGKTPASANLQNEKFIMISEEENPILYMHAMNYCRTLRFFPNIANRANDAKAVMLSVATGQGISILPESFVKTFNTVDVLDAIPIKDATASIICAAAWKKSLLNPAASLFLEVMKGESQE